MSESDPYTPTDLNDPPEDFGRLLDREYQGYKRLRDTGRLPEVHSIKVESGVIFQTPEFQVWVDESRKPK